MWNQLCKNGNFADVSWWIAFNTQYSISNGEASISKTSSSSLGFLYKEYNDVNLVLGHKYYLAGTAKTSSSRNCYIGMVNSGTGLFLTGSVALFNSSTYSRSSVVFTYSDSAYSKFAVRVNNSDTTTDTMNVKDIILIDLTLMFGSGNEPATVEEFEKLFPLPYYDYNTGVIISNKTEQVKVVGFNQWDEELEGGDILASTGINTPTTARSRTKNYIPCFPNTNYYYRTIDSTWASFRFYDAGKKFLGQSVNMGVNKNTIFTTPVDAYYMRFVLQNTIETHDICINISDPAKNGTYEPYKANTIELNLPTLTGKVNGEGESVVICPDGLRSAGSAFDEGIVENGYLTRIIKRIGVVDLGDLTWSKYLVSSWRASIIAKGSGNSSIASNLLCVKYENDYANRVVTSGIQINKTIAINGAGTYVMLCDNSLDNSSGAQVGSALTGTKLYYELAEPITYILDTPVYVEYLIDPDGTERSLPDDTSSAVSTEFVGSIKYPRYHLTN